VAFFIGSQFIYTGSNILYSQRNTCAICNRLPCMRFRLLWL